MTARCYFVATEPYFNSSEPWEGPEQDTMFVRARNARRARILAVRAWRRAYRRRGTWNQPLWMHPSENPFKGLKAEQVCDRCLGSGEVYDEPRDVWSPCPRGCPIPAA